ncbi:hypothetical protein BDV96DRAFT_655588 [Lophiotrema nucula]|uniref:Nascent polypeptide-associated complex subunit alpha-like UBA domain-containing protein n=1 Tax=Lophiotrema nucula TaxID=690887 RepID=A0A6A5YF29_9PLEO|nr:hypothetical protein BDV96DRAFT_655588 [Lophiotrema nucula]
MAEPQPSNIQEGASDPPPPAGSAEDRKAAAALSSLDANDDAGEKKDVDNKALGEAMKNLSVEDKEVVPAKKEEKKAIKVDPADVTLLVSELELPKPKVLELLRQHDGDAVQAMKAWVTASA